MGTYVHNKRSKYIKNEEKCRRYQETKNNKCQDQEHTKVCFYCLYTSRLTHEIDPQGSKDMVINI